MHTCSLCQKKYKHKRSLKTHLKICGIPIEQRKVYRCTFCDYGANREKHLIAHEMKCALKTERVPKNARSESRYPLENRYCQYCDYVTNRQRDLEGHEEKCPKKWESLTQKKPILTPDQSIFTLKKRKLPIGTV